MEDRNIVDVLLTSHNYIIMLSGLDKSPISTVSEKLVETFNKENSYAIELDFMHLPIGDTNSKIENRLDEVRKTNKRIIVVKSQTSPKLETDDYVIYINISINDTMINNTSLSSKYKMVLARNKPNRYFNYKKETDIEEYVDNIFEYIVDDIERKVYGDQYRKFKSRSS